MDDGRHSIGKFPAVLSALCSFHSVRFTFSSSARQSSVPSRPDTVQHTDTERSLRRPQD